MKLIKSFLALSAILCVSVLYAEENTYIKQQVAYKDHGASGKELTWDFEHIYQEGELLEISTCRKFRQVQQEGNRMVNRERLP